MERIRDALFRIARYKQNLKVEFFINYRCLKEMFQSHTIKQHLVLMAENLTPCRLLSVNAHAYLNKVVMVSDRLRMNGK